MAWGRLALLQAEDNEQALDRLAEVFGYEKIRDEGRDEYIARANLVGGFQAKIVATGEVQEPSLQPPPARFPRINKIVNWETDRDDSRPPDFLSDPAMRLPEADTTGTYCFASPSPLMSMARLLPFLFNGLGQNHSGRDLDHRVLLRRMEQAKPLQKLPKRQRRRWPQRLQIFVDASRRLEPFWGDFEAIVRQMQTLLGAEAVEALRFDEDTLGSEACYCLPWPTGEDSHWTRWRSPLPDVAILVLGDLGVGDSRAAVAWRRQLACLQSHPAPVLTLSPAFRSPNDGPLVRRLSPNSLNDAIHLPRHPSCRGFTADEPSEETIDDILAWLAPLPLVDAGLLRQLRVELEWGDSALEALLWNHPKIQDIGLGIRLHPDVAEGYRQRFQHWFAASDTAKRFWDIVNEHHSVAYQGLRQLEKFNRCVYERRDDPVMRDYFRRLCASGMQGESDSARQRALQLQCRTALASRPHSIWHSELKDVAYDLYAVAFRDEIRLGQWPQVDPGFKPERLQWLVDKPTALERVKWRIVQAGDQGQIKCELSDGAIDVTVPLVEFEAARGFPPRFIAMGSGTPVIRLVENNMTIMLPENGLVTFEAESLKIELDATRRPSWASRIWRDAEGLWATIPWLDQELGVFWQVSQTAVNGRWQWPTPFGEDEFGLYVDLGVEDITQRFRWIEPGSFWMGSPEDEPEREWGGHEEGRGIETLHYVTLSQGFWLADTTVTQALWLAVMGDNPSRFQDNPQNPVEQVSWRDVQGFIARLNGLFPGLNATLPSEAQWEYACRAGTDTPFSFGSNMTPEQVNYHGEFPYAGGEKGSFRERTVPVKSLPANPWGLYEMHGNVWEWCADAWRQRLPVAPAIDPLMSGDGGGGRVVRGGSWDGHGGVVRSALRIRHSPDNRHDFLGFRLALGHVRGGSGQEHMQAAGGGSGRRVAEQRQTESPPADGGQPFAKWIKRLKKWTDKS